MCGRQLSSQVRILCFAVSAIFGCCVYGQPWSGRGDSADPYQIYNATDLNAIDGNSLYLSAHFVLMDDIDLAGITYPEAVIGDSDSQFLGVFDGNGHIISNLTIDTASADANNLGLFGYLGFSAVVRDLGLENITISAGNFSENIGALAGLNSGYIQRCYASGTITGGTSAHNVGGLVGVNGQNVENSYAAVDVSGGASSQAVGGVIGWNLGLASNCYASGNVAGGAAVGGFAGDDYFISIIAGCYFLHPDDGGGPDNGLGTALTQSQMMQQHSFVNWDFFGEVAAGMDDFWVMDGYPVLGWQVPVGMREFALLSRFWMVSDCAPGQLCKTIDYYSDGSIDMNDLVRLTDGWMLADANRYDPPFGDDFETGDFSGLPWVSYGDANWIIDSNAANAYEGYYSARSGDINDSNGTALELTVDTTGYDLIRFRYKVSSETDFDFLVFYIDGSQRASWAGEYGWDEIEFNVYSGETTFKWLYYKDGSGSSGADCAWLDKIEFVKLD